MSRPDSPNPVGYLVNQYPKVSHSFIRREIAALEALGQPVVRFTIRAADDLPDADDRAEAERTHVLLHRGPAGLLGPTLRVFLTSPGRWCSALWQTLGMGRRSSRGLLRHLVYLAEACKLGAALRGTGVRHLHAHFGTNPAAVARLTHTLTGIPFSFTVHGPEEFDSPEALSLREKAADAEFVAVVSSYGRSQLFRWIDPEDWGKVHEVHCGLDPVFFEGTAVSHVSDSETLVCVGRLCEQKGQLLLCEAIAALKRRGITGRLTLVGDGEMRPAIERHIHKLEIADRVEITGWASAQQVRDHLRGARALVLPSFAEGLPVVIMEALALGRPVVSTYVAGIPELVDASCGWLVPAGSVSALTDALERVFATSPEELSELGRAGATRVKRRHDAMTEAEKLLAAIRGREESPGGRDTMASVSGEMSRPVTSPVAAEAGKR